MSHNPVFNHLLQQITPGLERRVMGMLADHISQENRISGDDLVRQAVLSVASYAKPQETGDRRKGPAASSLQEQVCPIQSDSGEGGLWSDIPDMIEAYLTYGFVCVKPENITINIVRYISVNLTKN